MVNGLLLLTLLLANLPFLTERLLGIFPLKHTMKPIGWCGIEIIVLYCCLGGLTHVLEAQQGPVHAQHWQFYAATFCLFLVFAFPGLVFRYLWRKPGV
jgi:hypothetical protein